MILAVALPLIILPTLLSAFQNDSRHISDERRLFHHLVDNYERSVRPVRHQAENITVKLGLALLNIPELWLKSKFVSLRHTGVTEHDQLQDEEAQVLHTTTWTRMMWEDFQLEWTPEDFGGLTVTRIPIHYLWYPDIAILNSVDPDMEMVSHHMALVTNDGGVMWIPPVAIRTHCPLDVLYFPFDTQTCKIKFASWTTNQRMIDMVFFDSNENIDMSDYVPSNQWEVVETSGFRNVTTYSGLDEPYVDIEFSITLQRHRSFGLHLFLLPSVILSLVIPIVFALPTGSNGKITLGVGVLIAHVLLLGEVIKFVPSGHHISVPLMAQFSVINIVLVSLSLVISTIVVNLWSRGVNRLSGPPTLIKLIFLHPLFTRILCFDFTQYAYDTGYGFDNPMSVVHNAGGSTEVISDPNDSNDDKIRIMQDKERHLVVSEWHRLADVIDRLFLILYFVIVVITSLSFLRYL